VRTCISLLTLLLLTSPALAEEAAPEPSGHFDRDAIVSASNVFRGLAERQGAALGPLERSLGRTDKALAALDMALALVDGAIDQAQHDLWVAKLDERSARFGAEFRVVQQQLDERGLAYEQAFEQALERALAALTPEGGELVECQAAASNDPFALTGPGGQTEKKTCPGEDVSEKIAAAWDGDAELTAALDAIDGEKWPEVTTYEEPQAVLGLGSTAAGTTWIAPQDLVDSLPEGIELVDAITERTDAGRQQLLAARDQLDPKAPDAEATVEAIRAKARGLREWSEARKAEVGGVIWAAVEKSRKKGKKAGWGDVGICVNPEGWGGCAGRDVTEEVADLLVDDKKLAKALGALLEQLGEPDVSVP